MTVSERASRIYKLIKPSGKTWADAMKQAHSEIFEEEAGREEADAQRELEQLELRTNDEPGPLDMNYLLNDIIISIEEDYIKRSLDEVREGKREGKNIKRYPYSRARAALEHKFGMQEFEDLIYDYTKKDLWDIEWRDPDTGRIKATWINEVNKLIEVMGVDKSTLDNYMSVVGYFR